MTDGLDYRPKQTDNPDPGPIANAREHLPLIRRECMPPTVTAVERLIEYAELLTADMDEMATKSSDTEALDRVTAKLADFTDRALSEPGGAPPEPEGEPDWAAIQEEASPARGDLYFATCLLRAYHEAVHAKPPAEVEPDEGWRKGDHGIPNDSWRPPNDSWHHPSGASVEDRDGRFAYFADEDAHCDPSSWVDTFAEAARLALGGVK